jgi:hypothetical protein
MSEINRRQLLKGIVMGSTGALSVSTFASLGLGQPASSQEAGGEGEAGGRNMNFAMGFVKGIDGATVVALNEGSIVQRIELTSATRVWKGQDTTLEEVKPGDFFYARGTPTADGGFIAETIWVNIVNLHLQIVDIQADRHVFTGPHGLMVGLPQPYTVAISLHGDEPASRNLSGLQIGQHVQVIGVWHPGTNEFDVSKIFY